MRGFATKCTDSPSLSQHEQRLWEIQSTSEPSHLAFPFYGDLPLLQKRQARTRSVSGRSEWRGPFGEHVFVSAIHRDGSFSLGRVDLSDWENLANRGTWITTEGYFATAARPRTYMHHLVAGYPNQGLVTDHINGWRNDNSKMNLRHATWSEQNKNARRQPTKWCSTFWQSRGEKYLTIKITLRVPNDWTGKATGLPSLLALLPNVDKIREDLFIPDPVKRSNV